MTPCALTRMCRLGSVLVRLGIAVCLEKMPKDIETREKLSTGWERLFRGSSAWAADESGSGKAPEDGVGGHKPTRPFPH